MQTEFKQHANKGMVTVFYPVPTVLHIGAWIQNLCTLYRSELSFAVEKNVNRNTQNKFGRYRL